MNSCEKSKSPPKTSKTPPKVLNAIRIDIGPGHLATLPGAEREPCGQRQQVVGVGDGEIGEPEEAAGGQAGHGHGGHAAEGEEHGREDRQLKRSTAGLSVATRDAQLIGISRLAIYRLEKGTN